MNINIDLHNLFSMTIQKYGEKMHFSKIKYLFNLIKAYQNNNIFMV